MFVPKAGGAAVRFPSRRRILRECPVEVAHCFHCIKAPGAGHQTCHLAMISLDYDLFAFDPEAIEYLAEVAGQCSRGDCFHDLKFKESARLRLDAVRFRKTTPRK